MTATVALPYWASVGTTGQRLDNDDRALLCAHGILRDLSDGLRSELMEKFHVEDVNTGVHLLEEGQPNSRLFFVLKGAVSVKLPKQARRVSEVKLATLGPGEIFGEYSLFDAQPVSAAVYATAPTRVAWLEKSDLDAFVDSHRETNHRLYESVIRILVARLRAKDAELDFVTIG